MGGYYYDGMGYDVGQPAGVGGVAALTYAQQVAADSPRGYWKLSEASGVTATDSSGNTWTGTYVNTPSLGVTAGPMTGETAATFTAASSQQVTMADVDIANPDILTIEAWVKVPTVSSGTFRAIFGKATNAYTYDLNATGSIRVLKSQVALIATSTAPLPDTNWNYVAWTKSGATNVIYLNGADVTGVVTNATLLANNSATSIAADLNVAYMDGSLAHVAIYETALSAARISAHYAARA